jgi:hypothetical protein
MYVDHAVSGHVLAHEVNFERPISSSFYTSLIQRCRPVRKPSLTNLSTARTQAQVLGAGSSIAQSTHQSLTFFGHE